MVLSKRERYVALVTVIAVAVLGLDHYALTPLLDRREQLRTDKASLLGELTQAQALFDRRKLLTPVWRRMAESGLNTDAASAEPKALNQIREWYQQSRLNMTSLKPERTSGKDESQEIAFQAAGTGTMESVARFLWLLETSPLPFKIEQLQLGARKEGVDDLTVQVRISALCLSPASLKPPAKTTASRKAKK